MQLLLCLAEHAGEVVSIDDLLDQVWSGVNVSPDSVYQAVTSLRRVLGDDAKQPTYIATVPRLGYRMVATVCPWADRVSEDQPIAQTGSARDTDSEHPTPAATDVAENDAPTPSPRRTGVMWAAVAALCLALVVATAFRLHFHGKNYNNSAVTVVPQSQKSIAVLPFLDLTEGRTEGTFADGMTEELIDKLSRIPGFQVPAPTSSFYFKGKQIPIADIAKTLGVAYVLDGSVRKSNTDGWLRVAARLIRVDNGYVVWSETYDQPLDDILMVQDDIAGEVTKALRASIEAIPARDKSQ